MIALAFGALSLALVQSVRRTAIAAAAVALGLGLGLIVSSHIGSFEYLASVDTTGGAQADDASGREITTLSIRRQWRKMLSAIRPIGRSSGTASACRSTTPPERH